tara:strand:- start:271 stop:396 length:126 start_codon:yes stop_codon:yes gene_type:complete
MIGANNQRIDHERVAGNATTATAIPIAAPMQKAISELPFMN